MQALANVNSCNNSPNGLLTTPIYNREPTTITSTLSSTFNGNCMTINQHSWTMAERIGGKISIDLANDSSANNSGRGSKSSGLQVIFFFFFKFDFMILGCWF